MDEPIKKPILFSAPMVRAILEGRKTQTRRIVKPQPPSRYNWNQYDGSEWFWNDRQGDDDMMGWWPSYEFGQKCPYGKVGELLWVRETWRETGSAQMASGSIPKFGNRNQVAYFVDGEHDGPWRPSIFMPRWASRITLKITDVRVQRLQDISESDAIAEGIEQEDGHWKDYLDGDSSYATSAIFSYKSLWQSINGADSWDANPWVWVIEFKRLQPAHA